MNRKQFLRNIGLGVTATLLPVSLFSSNETQYRIPKIEEFVNGFEYEKGTDSKLVLWDASKNKDLLDAKWQRFWNKTEVPSFREPDYPYTIEIDGQSYTFMNSDGMGKWNKENYYKRIKYELKQGLIRVKV